MILLDCQGSLVTDIDDFKRQRNMSYVVRSQKNLQPLLRDENCKTQFNHFYLGDDSLYTKLYDMKEKQFYQD